MAFDDALALYCELVHRQGLGHFGALNAITRKHGWEVQSEVLSAVRAGRS